MTPDTILFLGILATTIILALVAYQIGKREGAAAERIKTHGNTLPRFENPPAPPKPTTEPPCCQRVGCKKDALWRVEPNDGGPLNHILCCTDHMQERVDRLQGKPYKVTRIEDKEKKKGVPTMPNHPPMPDIIERVDQAYRGQNGRDPLPGVMNPEAEKERLAARPNPGSLQGNYLTLPDVSDVVLSEEEKKIFNTDGQRDFALWIKRRAVQDKRAKEIGKEQLIESLFDMRLENFLCAHTIPAHAGTDLYYLSRKETAEYLLDMYHITPKAKH